MLTGGWWALAVITGSVLSRQCHWALPLERCGDGRPQPVGAGADWPKHSRNVNVVCYGPIQQGRRGWPRLSCIGVSVAAPAPLDSHSTFLWAEAKAALSWFAPGLTDVSKAARSAFRFARTWGEGANRVRIWYGQGVDMGWTRCGQGVEGMHRLWAGCGQG